MQLKIQLQKGLNNPESSYLQGRLARQPRTARLVREERRESHNVVIPERKPRQDQEQLGEYEHEGT